MITGALVVGLLVARELFRSRAPDGAAARALGRMLLPAGIGLGLVMAVRLAALVVDGA